MRWVPYNFAPRNWAFCDGQLVQISQNTALFSIIGTYYGGNGTSNFALPDARSRSIAGPGQGPGLTDHVIGEQWGTPTVTLLITETASHSHSLSAVNTAGNLTDQTSANNSFCAGNQYTTSSSSLVTLHPTAVGFAGGSQPHNNRQPCLGLSLIICMLGVFPPRS